MKFKVGDVIKIDKYRAVITRAPEGYLDDMYSFIYEDGTVDEQDEGYIERLGAEIVGHIGRVPNWLNEIKGGSHGRSE